MSQNDRDLLYKVVILLTAIAIGILLLGSGCGVMRPAYNGAGSTPSEQLTKTASRIGWAAPFTALGIGGGVFLVFMGLRKLGIAVAAGSIAATVHALVVAKYAWLLAVFGLMAYTATMYLGFKKKQADNERMASGFVLGFQGVKDFIVAKLRNGSTTVDISRSDLNKIMGAALQPETEGVVRKIKDRVADSNKARVD